MGVRGGVIRVMTGWSSWWLLLLLLLLHHFVVKFSKNFHLRRQEGTDPLTKILRTPVNQGADVGDGQMSRRAEHDGDDAGG